MGNEIVFDTKPYVFLFDADAKIFEDNYSVAYGKALFNSILLLQNPISSRIYMGDFLLTDLCQRISSVKKSSLQRSVTYNVDPNLYASLSTELVRSMKEQANVIAVSNIATMLKKHNIFAVTICDMTFDSWEYVCRGLEEVIGYLASFQVDMGNPLHTDLFIRYMIPSGFLKGNELFLPKFPFEMEDDLIPCWVQDFSGIRTHFLDVEEYENRCPPICYEKNPSNAGIRYINLMKNKGEPDFYQRLATELFHGDKVGNCEFSVPQSFSWDHVDIPEAKFTHYALNLEHEKGGKSKAKLFKDLLNITKEDWRYLAAQIENAMGNGTICGVRQTEYGVQFYIDILIKGLNDVSRIVRTAWIIRCPNRCSLTTAYILDQSKQIGGEGKPPLIVQTTDPELFCSILYGYASSAGERAAEKYLTTPMYIDGYEEPVLEGIAGFAWILIHDARKRFPRWLKKKGIGCLGDNGGWVVHSPVKSQSYEKSKVYADAFAKILRQNGIDCKVESRLD